MNPPMGMLSRIASGQSQIRRAVSLQSPCVWTARLGASFRSSGAFDATSRGESGRGRTGAFVAIMASFLDPR